MNPLVQWIAVDLMHADGMASSHAPVVAEISN